MKYSLLITFVSLALFSNAQTDKSEEPFFRLGVLGNYYLCQKQEEDLRTYSDGSTETVYDTTDLSNGGLGFYSTLGYAFGNGLRVGVEGKAYMYRDRSYSIGLFGMVAVGPVVEYEASDMLTLYTKFNWNIDYAFKNYSDRRAYSVGAGVYVAIPDYEFVMVRLNLEYMASGGSIVRDYDIDGVGVELVRVESVERYRGLVVEVGVSVGF
jgi:hypothetical protein